MMSYNALKASKVVTTSTVLFIYLSQRYLVSIYIDGTVGGGHKDKLGLSLLEALHSPMGEEEGGPIPEHWCPKGQGARSTSRVQRILPPDPHTDTQRTYTHTHRTYTHRTHRHIHTHNIHPYHKHTYPCSPIHTHIHTCIHTHTGTIYIHI